MNVDAQEAALGLLSMGHNYLSQPIPSTSSATLNSILTTTASPIIPQKRKQSDIDQPDFTGNHVELLQQQQQPYLRLANSPATELSPRSNGPECNDTSTETVDCICGFAVDDGFSIACDECSRWCHSACFGIAPGSVPEKFACWTCKPRSAVEKEKAVRLQRDRLGMADGDGKEAKQRRRSSPGLERRQRRGPNAAPAAPVDGAGPGKRKRRPSMTQQPPTPTITQTTPNGLPEEDQIDIDNEPWREYYVHIAQDIIPNDDTRSKLRHQAVHWRGVTAVSSSPQHPDPAVVPSSSLETPPPVSVKPLSPQSSLNPFLSQNSNPLVLPPAFSLHTTQAIPSHSLITPFHSCITPSSTYLADPLNAYAHLGMPKPYVHLLGPPLDVALDARIVGNHGRFARWGCKPNAVLRPILCERGSKEMDDEATLGFGVFATKDMKANEEIVLGWEWDDGNAVHLLPALLETPDTFPLTLLSTDRPHNIQHIKNQMSNILHALSSTFTTCACGALSKDCALTQMAAFVDGHDLGSLLRRKDQSNEVESDDDTTKIDIGPLVGRKRGFRTKERIPHSGGLGGMQMAADEDILGNGKGFVWDGRRYKEGIPSLPSFVVSPFSPSPTKKGKARALAVDEDAEMMDAPARVGGISDLANPSNLSDNLIVLSPTRSEPVDNPPSEPRPPDPPDGGGDGNSNPIIDEAEERMPPKMRKKWMHRELEARKEPSTTKDCQVGLGITVDLQDEHHLMPPPPMPASLDPTTISSTSATIRSAPLSQRSPTRTPSSTDATTMSPPPNSSGVSPLASFAQLSLLSPALNSEMPCQPEVPTQDQGKPEIGVEAQVETSVAILSPPKTTTEDSLIEDHASPPSDLEFHAPGFSRTHPIYSRRHDEDDEVDYSPQSPEPSFQDVNMDQQVLPQLHPNTSDFIISHSIRDNEACDDVEPHADDQATLVTPSAPPPTSTPTSPLSTIPPVTSPEPELCLTSQELQQPPPPKVKLTLKDFALRRKRQREEQAMSQNIQASPVTPSPVLPPEAEEELKSPNIAKMQLEVSGQGDCVIDDLHRMPTSPNNPNTVPHVVNGARDVEGVEIKSKESLTPRNDTTVQNENENRTNLNSNQSPLLSTTPFAKPAAATLNANGRLPLSRNLPNRPQPPALLPSRPIQEQHPTFSKTNSRDMKQELIETLVPPLSRRVSGIERSVSPISPDPTPMGNRISQEEEGEIGETPHSSSRGPSSKRDPDNLQQPLSRNGPPFSHPPPIGPRFYLNQPTSPSSVRPTPPSVPIPSVAANANTTNGNRPNLPTGPRALLRQSMLHRRSGSGPPAASHSPSLLLPPHDIAPGSPFIPRGPSADRDKELEWERRHYRALPRRGAGNGRGTPWGR